MFIGGGVGAVARWVISARVQRYAVLFPLGTLTVNLLGSFLLGFIMAAFRYYGVFTRTQILLLATGLCGAFTTFSTFAYETFTLLRDAPLYGVLYVIASLAGGLLAVYAGFVLAGTVYGR